jgi:hypothetical protein
MQNTRKIKLHVALQALARMQNIPAMTAPDARTHELGQHFIARAQASLEKEQKLKTQARQFERHLNKAALDEQGLSHAEMLRNYYFYALADLAHYFVEEHPAALDGVTEWAAEQASAAAMAAMFADQDGALIMTPELIDVLEKSDLVQAEKNAQLADLDYAETAYRLNDDDHRTVC